MAQAKPVQIPAGTALRMVKQLKCRNVNLLEELLKESGILQEDVEAAAAHGDAALRFDSPSFEALWDKFALCWRPPGQAHGAGRVVVCSCWQFAWFGHCTHQYIAEMMWGLRPEPSPVIVPPAQAKAAARRQKSDDEAEHPRSRGQKRRMQTRNE